MKLSILSHSLTEDETRRHSSYLSGTFREQFNIQWFFSRATNDWMELILDRNVTNTILNNFVLRPWCPWCNFERSSRRFTAISMLHFYEWSLRHLQHCGREEGGGEGSVVDIVVPEVCLLPPRRWVTAIPAPFSASSFAPNRSVECRKDHFWICRTQIPVKRREDFSKLDGHRARRSELFTTLAVKIWTNLRYWMLAHRSYG